MPTKRPAIEQLNWNNYDEDENRIIIPIKARRVSENFGNDVQKNPFFSFSGFRNLLQRNLPSFFGKKKQMKDGTSIDSKTKSSSPDFKKDPSSENKIDPEDTKYFQNLKKLNETFIKWIQINMEKNPFCNFTSVCKNYKDHFLRLNFNLPNYEEYLFSEVEADSKNSRFIPKVKKLNETFVKWIKIHMVKNLCSDFTPVCEDYRDHISRLEHEFLEELSNLQPDTTPESVEEPVCEDYRDHVSRLEHEFLKELPSLQPDTTPESVEEPEIYSPPSSPTLIDWQNKEPMLMDRLSFTFS